jgi:hypothetical protein
MKTRVRTDQQSWTREQWKQEVDRLREEVSSLHETCIKLEQDLMEAKGEPLPWKYEQGRGWVRTGKEAA